MKYLGWVGESVLQQRRVLLSQVHPQKVDGVLEVVLVEVVHLYVALYLSSSHPSSFHLASHPSSFHHTIAWCIPRIRVEKERERKHATDY